MDVSKRYVLIVGNDTSKLTAGSCSHCDSYNRWTGSCARGHSIDKRSYIEYECDKAVEAGIKIVVLYNDTTVTKSKCPETVRYRGNHVPMVFKSTDDKYYWDYNAVKKALEDRC